MPQTHTWGRVESPGVAPVIVDGDTERSGCPAPFSSLAICCDTAAWCIRAAISATVVDVSPWLCWFILVAVPAVA